MTSWKMTVEIVYSMEEKFSVSDPQNGSCTNLPPGKIYLETEPPGKRRNQGTPWIFTSIPLHG